MRVVACTASSDLGETLRRIMLETDHEFRTLTPDEPVPVEADVLVLDGELGGLDDRVSGAGASAPTTDILLIASREHLSQIPASVSFVAVAPLRPNELLFRLRLMERQRARAALVDLLSTAVEAAGDIIEISDTDIVLQYVNPAYKTILGVDVEEAIGNTPAKLVASGMHPPEYFQEIDRTLRAGRVWKGMLVSRARDGRLVYFESTISPVVNREGVTTDYVAVKHDITARIKTKEALRDANEELTRARDAALEANRAKSQFLANMSHELRTPLNAIIGYSEMLSEEATEDGHEAVVNDLEKIRSAGTHLLSLINDVLDISKIEAGKMELYLESFKLTNILETVVGTIRPLVTDRGNELEVQYEGDLGVMRADLTKLRQTLLNLLSNANKFTENGKVLFRARIDRELEGGPWAVFEVRDSGIGMSVEQQRRVFSPFVQADPSTTRRYGGTGLGLAISDRFCRMMGGSIRVESEIGKGARFTVRLPLQVAEPESTSRKRSIQPDGARHSVVVIDDDPIVHDLLMRTLSTRGCAVQCYDNGPEGIAAVRALLPDLVILDVMMPGMDGWMVLSTLKSDERTVDIPVVMLTMVDRSEVGYTLGAADYLVKPIEPGRLTRALKRHWMKDAKQVLIVEDDAPAREVMRRTLESGGHEVVEAETGRMALAMMREDPPDLVLLDLMMPEMDGFEVLEHIQADETLSRIPVVAVTAKALSDEEMERLDGVVQRIVRKGDYSRRQLLDLLGTRVDEALSKTASDRP